MIFYFIPLLTLLFANSKNRFILFVFFVSLALAAGYRADSVGTDTTTYLTYFYQIKSGTLLSIEPLWVLANKAVAFMGGDFETLKLFASFLTLLPLFLIYRRLDKPFFALFIYLSFYYYFYSYNIVRQCIAMSWTFYGVFLLEEGTSKAGRKYGWIWFVFAWGFHVTAIVIPFFYYIRGLFVNKRIRIYLTLLITAVLGVILGSFFIGIARSIFSSYSDLEEATKSPLIALLDLGILNLGFIAVYEGVVKKNFTIWFYFFFVFVLLTNLMVMLPFGNRFIFYAGITLSLFLTRVVSFPTGSKKMHNIVVVLIVFYAYFRYIRLLGGGSIFPYINSFFNIEIAL